MRRPFKKKNIIGTDLVYDSVKISKVINYIMVGGKKTAARKIVYGALDIIKEKEKGMSPMEVFELALKNATPQMEVRSRRIGGANYQVPREVRPERRFLLAFRWIIEAARAKKGAPMKNRFAEELMLAAKNEGAAIKKKEDTHRMAEANKAFAHFTW
ncbi:MAG: 30S ribosomal protein S7 [Patescibacteria group bacterium]